jgi:DNA-binding GntR family transcriptional regulator
MALCSRSERRDVGKKEFIRNRLRDDIVQGRYEPGDPVPERVVAEELEVSRIPVREALIELERDGLVSILPRRGAYVQVFTAENMQSLYETREALEGMAARLAAQRMNPAILASLKERYERVLRDHRNVRVHLRSGKSLPASRLWGSVCGLGASCR